MLGASNTLWPTLIRAMDKWHHELLPPGFKQGEVSKVWFNVGSPLVRYHVGVRCQHISVSPWRDWPLLRCRVHLGCQWSRYPPTCSLGCQAPFPLSNTHFPLLNNHCWAKQGCPGPRVTFYLTLHFHSLPLHMCALRESPLTPSSHSAEREAMTVVYKTKSQANLLNIILYGA